MNLPNFDLSKLSVGSVKNAFDEVDQVANHDVVIPYLAFLLFSFVFQMRAQYYPKNETERKVR